MLSYIRSDGEVVKKDSPLVVTVTPSKGDRGTLSVTKYVNGRFDESYHAVSVEHAVRLTEYLVKGEEPPRTLARQF